MVTPLPHQFVSGGQTGADRAALDVALQYNFPHGGWCPAGRWAEDGPIPPRYHLRETPSSDPRQRTEWNVRDSDGTVLFTRAEKPIGGSLATRQIAQAFGKPFLHLLLRDGSHPTNLSPILREFLIRHSIRVLNVAGSRESQEPGIYSLVANILRSTFF